MSLQKVLSLTLPQQAPTSCPQALQGIPQVVIFCRPHLFFSPGQPLLSSLSKEVCEDTITYYH